MSDKIWNCRTSRYSKKFYTYFSVEISREYSPQDIQNEIELFEKYLWDKYYFKDEETTKQTWLQWIKNLLSSTKSQKTPE